MAEELNAKMSIYPKGTSFINDFNKTELIEFLAQFHFPADSRETLDELRKSATTFIKQKRKELADLGYGDVQDEEADEAIQQQQAAQYRENLEKQKQKEKQVRITKEFETEMRSKIERDLRKQIEKEMKDKIEREVTARLKEERKRKPEDKVSSEDSEEEEEEEEEEDEDEDEEKKKKRKEEQEDSKIVTEALVTLVKEMKLSRAHKEYSNIQTLANEIRRWEISFSGNTQESVDNFIDLLLEFKTLKKVPDNTIIALLPEVLKQNARSWYFLNRDDITSWNDLVTKLRQSYRVAGYETKLMKDLFNRTQENTEPIEQYVITMRKMNKRLSYTNQLSEKNLVSLMRDNLNPYYTKNLGQNEFHTYNEILLWGKSVEANYSQARNYKRPPASSQLVDPCFAYTDFIPQAKTYKPEFQDKRQYTQTNTYTNTKSREETTPKRFQNTLHFRCWNCDSPDHSYTHSQCTIERKKFCHICGKKDVSTYQCNCKSYRQEN